MKRGFSMIELIFVIVIIAILAGVAIPKFAVTRGDAIITKGKSDVAAIRAALATERQKRILRGDHNNTYDIEEVLEYGLSDRWKKDTDGNWTFKIDNTNSVKFILTGAKFDCDHTDDNCNKLTK